MEKLIEEYKNLRWKYIRKAVGHLPILTNFIDDLNQDFIIAQIRSWEHRNKDIDADEFKPAKYFDKVFYYEYLKVMKDNIQYHNGPYAYSALTNCCKDDKQMDSIPMEEFDICESSNYEIKKIIESFKYQKNSNTKEELLDYYINGMTIAQIAAKYKKTWSTIEYKIKDYGKQIFDIYNKKATVENGS